jgi:hypothetical protein
VPHTMAEHATLHCQEVFSPCSSQLQCRPPHKDLTTQACSSHGHVDCS